MANVSITAGMFPCRLSLSKHAKLAGELTVEISNNDSKAKLLSIDLRLPEQVALDKAGLTRIVSKQVRDFQPSAKIRLNFPVFLTPRADVGVFSGKLLVSEHASDFEYPTTSYSKEVSFRIIG